MFNAREEKVLEGSTEAGQRVRAWVQSTEPRHVSVAVPGDRAKMTPREAIELGKWLIASAEGIQERNRAEGVRLAEAARMKCTPPPTQAAPRETTFLEWARSEAVQERLRQHDATNFLWNGRA
ncbi:hypothetical protein [Streptomyces avermitilis]|uniref:hypothetical protein n=1 Tax=Streptomyces avermitilis TaxID=33903 RepID=UPI00382D1B92